MASVSPASNPRKSNSDPKQMPNRKRAYNQTASHYSPHDIDAIKCPRRQTVEQAAARASPKQHAFSSKKVRAMISPMRDPILFDWDPRFYPKEDDDLAQHVTRARAAETVGKAAVSTTKTRKVINDIQSAVAPPFAPRMKRLQTPELDEPEESFFEDLEGGCVDDTSQASRLGGRPSPTDRPQAV